mmetsp:Transcript_30862/g.67730  ORF Transcript_30862/g.67730 Transcript_30862/m.67730 type:complete len:82 (+) Transcript_30862:103-348(+)
MEEGTVTELQMIQAEADVLKSVLEGVKKAETTSSACASLTATVMKLDEADGFIVPAGERERNPFHATATGGGGGGGCCVVS